MVEGEQLPEGGIEVSGRILARRAVVNTESGEVRGQAYRVLAGAEVVDVTDWNSEPFPIGAMVEWRVGVRAFVRKGGGAGWTLIRRES